ncbi:MAG: DNA-processing protein DprA [Actinobacteria bacterium]|nr:DNA-processing protein DprA [Actinomycetota bacterium]
MSESRVGGDERVARAALSRVCEPADAAVGRLVAQEGARVALEHVDRVSRRRNCSLAELLDRAHQDLTGINASGGRFIVPGDDEWPTQLDDLDDEAPFGIWLKGDADLRLVALRSVAIVGARAATSYGARIAANLASDLADRGWCVVSGGAYGVDAAAHRGSLAVDGYTVVVLASGVDVAYPASHEGLFARCAESGVLLSEAPPGEVARRWRFLDRNRLIAALTRGTVVIEAAHRSGALSTARRAADLGRQIMGVPGPVNSIASAGVHRLIRDGATLVTCADDVVREVDGGVVVIDQGVAIERLSQSASEVLAALNTRKGQSSDHIAFRCSRLVPDTLADLAELELARLARCTPTGWVSIARSET